MTKHSFLECSDRTLGGHVVSFIVSIGSQFRIKCHVDDDGVQSRCFLSLRCIVLSSLSYHLQS